jgi:acyl-CoA reductase-like NAD-dependent aldehyde dehydrogenase
MRGASGTLKKISLVNSAANRRTSFSRFGFEVAVEGALFCVFFNQGEVCHSGQSDPGAAVDL